MWSLLRHRPFRFERSVRFKSFRSVRFKFVIKFGTKFPGNRKRDSPDWVSGYVWKRNIAMVLGPRPPRGNNFQENDSHSPDRPKRILYPSESSSWFLLPRRQRSSVPGWRCMSVCVECIKKTMMMRENMEHTGIPEIKFRMKILDDTST